MKSLKNLEPLIQRYLELYSLNPHDKEYYVGRLTAVTKDFACRFLCFVDSLAGKALLAERAAKNETSVDELWELFLKANEESNQCFLQEGTYPNQETLNMIKSSEWYDEAAEHSRKLTSDLMFNKTPKYGQE